MPKSIRRTFQRAAQVAGILGVGFIGGYAMGNPALAIGRWVAPETERLSSTAVQLTSPYLECMGEAGADPGLVRVRADLRRYIARAAAQDASLQVSVYARDLHDGPWIGIDERLPAYMPASMWKLPLMVYLLGVAEGDQDLLSRELTYPGADRMRTEDSMIGAPEQQRLQPGKAYTYQDLLFRMIAYSDNHAEELLMTGLSKADIDRMLQAIGAEDVYVGGEPRITAKAYGALFRVLYNSTWLSRPVSEYALGLLTHNYMRNGLRRHVPAEVAVASKFGLYRANGPAGETQFHECGIVYHPRGPYILCVMTRSRVASPDRLRDIVADISRLTWQGKSAGTMSASPAK